MVLPADARTLVAAKRRVRRVGVVAVGPHPTGLDVPTRAVSGVHVAAPHAGAEAVKRVVGDVHGVVKVAERRHRHHWAEDLLLEDPHRVLAFEDRRRHVVAARKIAVEVRAFAAAYHSGTLGFADVDVGEDLLELVVAGLRADHRFGVQRVALDHLLRALGGICEELVVDGLLDQRPARAGADLALVEGEHRETLEGLVVEVIVAGGDVVEEDVGAFSAELEGHRDDVRARVLHDQTASGGLARERDLADPAARRQRLSGFHAEPVDDVQHAGGKQVAHKVDPQHDRSRGLFCRLEHDGVACG